jgi:hypothetical protein
MESSKKAIPIIPFKQGRYAESKEYLLGRVINFQPISDDGENNITYNIDKII